MAKTLITKRPVRTSSVARIAHALSDDTRVAIVELLAANGELCVCDIVEALDLAQPLLSHHLRVLREATLLRDRRQGRWTYYALERSSFISYTLQIASIAGDSAERLGAQHPSLNTKCR